MHNNNISNVQDLVHYVSNNSTWSAITVCNAITALGYRGSGGLENLKGLSATLADYAKHGVDSGLPGFTYYSDTLAFFRRNRKDIVKNLELTAEESGEDIINMVRNFGVFRYDTPPSSSSIGKVLWGTGKLQDDLTSLFNQPLQRIFLVLSGRNIPYLVQIPERQPRLLCGIVRITPR
jgi:hypothetical protein